MKFSCTFQQNKQLAEISTFGIGGPAKYFIEVNSIDAMRQALEMCQKLNLAYIVIGKGSNSLFASKGFNGLVIQNKINFLNQIDGTTFYVGSGFSFSHLGTITAKLGLSGLEFASGIPGSVGGAVFMNAGANGMETCQHLTSVEFLDETGEIKNFSRQELLFSYRTSLFQQMKGVILSATFSLAQLEKARDKQLEILKYRKKTQPYGDMSAGCIFQNPSDLSAGALIEKCGLKGMSVGDAKVSDVHANFIINSGKATSDDVLELIELIKDKVKHLTNQELHSEVRFIPYNP